MYHSVPGPGFQTWKDCADAVCPSATTFVSESGLTAISGRGVTFRRTVTVRGELVACVEVSVTSPE